MSITAIQGVCHDGKIEPLEKIPYRSDKRVIIVFPDDIEEKMWDDYMEWKGYEKVLQDLIKEKI